MTSLQRTSLVLFIVMAVDYSFVKGNCANTQASLNIVGVFDSYDTTSVLTFERAISRHNVMRQQECGANFTYTTLYVSQDMSVMELTEKANKALSDGSCFMIYSTYDAKGKFFLDIGIRLGILVVTTIKEFNHIDGHQEIDFNYDPVSVVSMNKLTSTDTKIEVLLTLLHQLKWRHFVAITDNNVESTRLVSALEETLGPRNIEMVEWFLFPSGSTANDVWNKYKNLTSEVATFLLVSNDNVLLGEIFFGTGGAGSWVILSDLDIDNFLYTAFPSDVLLITPNTQRDISPSSFVDDAVQSVGLALTETPNASTGVCPVMKEMRQLLSEVHFHGETGPVRFDERGDRLPDCYDIHRMYFSQSCGLADGPTEAYPMGYWCDGRLHITEPDNMRSLKILLNEYPPNVLSQPKIPGETCQSNSMPCTKEEGGKKTVFCCYGFVIDVIQQVASEYPFHPELLFTLDGQYGVYDETNDSWNGVVAELLNGRGDASLDLYISSRRANVVDFTEPYMPSGIRLLVREKERQDNQIYWLSYLRPFTPPVWLTLLGSLGIMICFLWVMDKISPVKGSRIIFHPNTSFGFDNAICFALALAFGRPADESKPTTNGARLSSVAFGMAMLVFVSTYSANLAAFLIVDDKTTPVDDIYDLKIERPPQGFKYGTISGSYMADYFKNSDNAYFRHIWFHMKSNNVKSLAEGVRAVRSGKLDVFIADSVGLEYESMNDPYCEFKVVGEPFAMSGAALAVKKGNALFVPLSKALAKLQAKGLTDFIQRFWVKKYSCTREIPPAQLRVEDLSGLFLQLTIAMIACVLGTWLHRTFRAMKDQYHLKKNAERDDRDTRYRFSHIETLV